MSYCFICGNPTPGSFGKCQACVARLAEEELKKEIEQRREERRVRVRMLIKVFVVLFIVAGIGGACYLRFAFRKEWDQFVKGEEKIFMPYIDGISEGIKKVSGSSSPAGVKKNGDNSPGPDGGADASFVSTNFSSGNEVLQLLRSKDINCELDDRGSDGIVLGDEVVYLDCDGEAAALYVFADGRKAQEGSIQLNESKKYALLNQVGNILFVMVSSDSYEQFDHIRDVFAGSK